VVRRAVEAGINWFDTAPGYGQGRSETSLGRALRQVQPAAPVHVATKVRLEADQLGAIADHVRRSVEASLGRLGVLSVTLLQLHNGITAGRGDEADTITPADVLNPHGVLAAFERLRAEGLVRFLGLTGTGHAAALRTVIRSGGFDTLQVPYHVLNPSADGSPAPSGETDHGDVLAYCAGQDMGVFAIRVFAGGALLDQPPSAHTLRTPYFPLALYERNRRRAAVLAERFAGRAGMSELALRFVLSQSTVHSAIIGFGSVEHVDEAVRFLKAGPLPEEWLREVTDFSVEAPPPRAV
jgi:L-galactose dehydrogenase/L-glyceraldehyde 3-phosphate reductase